MKICVAVGQRTEHIAISKKLEHFQRTFKKINLVASLEEALKRVAGVLACRGVVIAATLDGLKQDLLTQLGEIVFELRVPGYYFGS